ITIASLIEAQGTILSKQAIIAALGDRALTLPGLIGEALAANDRVKYRLTLLQVARHHADAPQAPVPGLRTERVTARIDDASLDALPTACTRDAVANYRLPGVEAVFVAIERDVRAMLTPILVARDAGIAEAADGVEARAAALLPPLLQHRDGFTAAELDGLSRVQRERGDSLHLFVMDLHKMLNRLQQTVATEVLDGASVYDLAAEDRDLVRAFMRGVNRTSRLRFDHPGLATTATRR